MKSYNIVTETLVHVANIDDVINMAIVPTFPKSLLISDSGKKLVQCDLRQLQTRTKATVCLNTGLDAIELNQSDKCSDRWRFIRLFDNTERDEDISEPIAIAATQTQIIIWRYNIKLKQFQAIHSLDTAEPVQSIYFTSKLSAIVSSNKFFEIDLMNLNQNRLEYEEFCDECDASLVHTLASKPIESFGINNSEYLLCFKDFGVFVDEYGRRSRSNDLKWLKNPPTAFAYRAPILFIFSKDGVQMIRIRKAYDDDHGMDEKLLETFISIKDPRFGTNCGKYGVYTLTGHEGAVAQHVMRIDGTKALRNALTDSLETVLSSDFDY